MGFFFLLFLESFGVPTSLVLPQVLRGKLKTTL